MSSRTMELATSTLDLAMYIGLIDCCAGVLLVLGCKSRFEQLCFEKGGRKKGLCILEPEPAYSFRGSKETDVVLLNSAPLRKPLFSPTDEPPILNALYNCGVALTAFKPITDSLLITFLLPQFRQALGRIVSSMSMKRPLRRCLKGRINDFSKAASVAPERMTNANRLSSPSTCRSECVK